MPFDRAGRDASLHLQKAPMHDRETCVDCGIRSPPMSEDQTLTSSMGWRLARERRPDGRVCAVWRCGDCWERHKAIASAGRAQTPSRAPLRRFG